MAADYARLLGAVPSMLDPKVTSHHLAHLAPPHTSIPLTSHQSVSLSHPPPQTSGIPPLAAHQHSLSHHSHPPRRDSSSSGMSSSSRPRNANNKQFLCPGCNRCFTQKGNLKTHMMIHTGEKPYACQICGKSFTQKGNVDTHMKIHTGEKEYNCHSCGKRFTQKGNLKTHVRSVHTKEKPFVCGMCGKSFSQKGNMQTHLRTHNKDDRFPCTLCGKTFSQKGNLKTHMQRHSGTLPARRYGPRRQSHSRLAHASGAAGMSSAAESRPVKSHLKPTDDESASPVEISMAPSAHQHNQQHQQHSSLDPKFRTDTPDEVLSSSHSALKLAYASSRDQSVLDSLHSTQHIHAHRNSVSSPVAIPQFSGRFYSSAPTLAPLAHAASWLSAAGASAGFGAKNRVSSTPYDNFGLGSYAGFTQAHPSHLSRLGLLNSPPPLGPLSVSESEHAKTPHTPGTTTSSSISSQQQTGNNHPQQQQQQQQQQQYSQSTANPDFSQLIE